MLDRRTVLQGAAGALALATPFSIARSARAGESVIGTAGLPQGAYDAASLEALPGKKPLIKLTYRPPNYETPVSYFSSTITPNDAFFVRYHHALIPPAIDVQSWNLQVGGAGTMQPITLSMDELTRDFEQVEIAAVCQCSGNRRGLSDPHVPGLQWGIGAMGSAVWKGVRLRDVLAKAGLRKEAVEIVLDGADGPVLGETPDFIKSIPAWKAQDENTIIAFQMNGEALPHLNGFPARLVLPGWTATYWMKHLTSIQAVTAPYDGFWVRGAYRIPVGAFPMVQRFVSQENETTTPITEMVVNTLITAPVEGQRFAAGQAVDVQGIAWDGGYGIRTVEVSTDGGRTWNAATLGADEGRFAFRPWTYRFVPQAAGNVGIMAKATNRIGQTQVQTLIFNGPGYHNNVPRPTNIAVA